MKTGVYVLSLDGKVVYVGATTKWPNRIVLHKEIEFNECRLIECDRLVMFQNERRLIRLFKPKHNRQHLHSLTRKPVGEWVLNNSLATREAFESGKFLELVNKMRNEVGYSPKSSSTDIAFSVVRSYCRQNNLYYNWETRKFKKVKA